MDVSSNFLRLVFVNLVPSGVEPRVTGSVLHCAALCLQDMSCTSLFYTKNNRKCILSKRTYSGTDVGISFVKSKGTKYYKIDNRAFPAPPKCDGGYVMAPNCPLCYKLYPASTKTWVQAERFCEGENAQLISLNTDCKKNIIESIVREGPDETEYFLGATDTAYEGEWRWMADNSVIPWFKKEKRTSNCFELELDNLYVEYDDTGCDHQRQPFFCEKII